MGRGLLLDRAHYQNWIKHANMRLSSGQYIPKDNNPFVIPIFKKNHILKVVEIRKLILMLESCKIKMEIGIDE